MAYKLFIPGPVAVSEKTYRAMMQPMIPHRSSEFVALYQEVQAGLRELMETQDPIYLSTSSSWGMMEAALHNVVQKKVLCCMNGAFSDKWLDVARRGGLEAGALQTDWGQPVDPEALRRELATGAYDAVTLIHNETSCGCQSDLPTLMTVLRDFPEVISIVDTVSSFAAMPIPKDALGIDILITGAQKALALPPGLCLCSVSARALRRAASVSQRGYYFDFLEFQKNWEQHMTPTTPSIAHIYGLRSKLEEIREEGMAARFERHTRLNRRVREWGLARGFSLFPREGHGSITLNCFNNDQNLDLPQLNKILKAKHGFLIDGGYGKLKGKTFRISNMGDETEETIAGLLRALEASLAETPRLPPIICRKN